MAPGTQASRRNLKGPEPMLSFTSAKASVAASFSRMMNIVLAAPPRVSSIIP